MKMNTKLKKTIIYLSIIASLTSGCAKNKTNNNNYLNFSNNSYNSNNSFSSSNYDNPITNKDEHKYEEKYITLSDESYNEFINYIKNYNTTYYYEEHYKINEAIAEYNKIKDSKVNTHSHSIKTITSDELYKVVKENNKIYLEEKKKEYVASFYNELKDSDLKRVCEIIINTLNHYQDNITDIEEVKCILGNLKILSKATLSNSSVTDDDCLLINLDMINTLKIKATSKDQDVVEDTISHEAVHLLQKSCEDNLKIKYRIGNSYKFDNLEVNSLFYNRFYEGPAEKLSNNYTGDTPLVYNYYINYINSLNLSTVLGNHEVDSAELTTLDHDLESLFKMFDCGSETDKREILNMMYSLNIIETDDEGFLKMVGLSNTSNEYITTKRNIKSSVCLTMTKHFYKNLALKVKEGNTRIQDIFYLITVFESDINSHLTYVDINKYQDNKEFIEEYITIQNNFFNLIAQNQNQTLEELEELYNNYGIQNSSGLYNYNLSFLTDEKQQFVSQILQNTKSSEFKQIRDCVENESKTKIRTK